MSARYLVLEISVKQRRRLEQLHPSAVPRRRFRASGSAGDADQLAGPAHVTASTISSTNRDAYVVRRRDPQRIDAGSAISSFTDP